MAVEPSKRPIRIAHLQLLPLMSGVQRVTLDEVTRLDRSRFDPYVICKDEGPFTEALRAAGIPYFCVPELVREISPLRDIKALWKLVVLFRAQRFDILHTHSSKTGILGRFAGKLAGVPWVMHTVHGYAFPAAKGFRQRAFYFLMEWLGARLTDALVLLNKHDLELAERRLGVPSRKLHLIPNGVDVTRFSPASPEQRNRLRRESLGVKDGQVAIGMVGRLWRQKNPGLFVKTAIELLRGGMSSLRFFLVGDGDEKNKLEDLIKNSGFEKEIRLLGWRTDVDRLLGSLDIFILPSLWEGMPLAILEAMAASLPVVVSDIPGNRDLVEEGMDGYLFNLKSETALMEKLRLLIADPELRKQFGSIGRKKVCASYTLDQRIKKMEHLYIENLEKRPF